MRKTAVLSYSVYSTDGARVGSVAHPAAAVRVASLYGDGATVKYLGRIVWREGSEDGRANNNFAEVTQVVISRAQKIRKEATK